jgi:hypothetical protein
MSKTLNMPRARSSVARTQPSKPVRRWAVPVGAAVLALIALCCALVLTAGGSTRSTAVRVATVSPLSMATVLTVDGQSVPVRELELFLTQDRAEAFAYYQQHYGDNDGPGFWSTAYGGQTPAGYLEKLAIADAVRATVQFNLAHTYGLIPDPGYAAFLKSLAAENASQAQAVSEHQPIYGPEQYSESTYFTYVLGQTGISLQTALIDHKVILVTGGALEQYYDAHRENYQEAGLNASGTDTGTGVAGPKAPSGIAPFAQVKDEVTQDYEAAEYNTLITRLAAAATVHIDAGVLADVQIS